MPRRPFVRRAVIWLAGTAGFILSAATAPAADFFVRSNGSDANDGRSPATAFATIRRAIQAIVNPGDRVIVGPGIYAEGNLTSPRSGIEGRPIQFIGDSSGTLTGDAPGEVVVAPPSTQTAGFRLLGHQHIVIEGFTIVGAFDAGIQVRASVSGANSRNITIRNNVIHGGAKRGIDVAALGMIVLESNVVLENGSTGISIEGCIDQVSPGRCGLPEQPRIDRKPRVSVRVSNNVTVANGGHGVLVVGADVGLIQNHVSASNARAGVMARGVPGLRVVNNLVYGNGEDGLKIGTGGLSVPRPTIMNNTVFRNAGWGVVIGGGETASPGALIVNNIFSGNLKGGVTVPIESTCGYVAGFNINTDGYGAKTPANSYDWSMVPQFLNPAGPDGELGGAGYADDDFRLSPGSPAIDAGSDLVDVLGIEGTASAAPRDENRIDLGFHYGASPDQEPNPRFPGIFFFVRENGDDRNDGLSARTALRTIRTAAMRAAAGTIVIVGPGRYAEGDIGPVPNRGRVTFIADRFGTLTGDEPGVVLVDAKGFETGFVLRGVCPGTIDGFHVTGATDAGIQIRRGSNGSRVRNNVVFSNIRRGIEVHDASDVRVINNLAYANGAGIQVGGNNGSPRSIIQNNTCYANIYNGLLIGAGLGSSHCARVKYNIFQSNGERGVQIGSGKRVILSRPGFDSGFNLSADRYGAGTPRSPSDVVGDAEFVAPAGADGVLGGDGFADDGFHLSHVATGQRRNSLAVDLAPVRADNTELAGRSTRSDNAPDSANLDAGYHYPGLMTGFETISEIEEESIEPYAEFCYQPVIAGDCNRDQALAIEDLVRAVRVFLGQLAIGDCLYGDLNDDGVITVDELITVIGNALTPSRTPTSLRTPLLTRTPTPTRSVTPTTGIRTATQTPIGTRTPSPTRTGSETPAPTRTASSTRTTTEIPPGTRTATPTRTANTPSPTRTGTEPPPPTRTPSATRTATETPQGTRTPSATRTGTGTPDPTRTASATRTLTETPEGTRTPSATRTATETPEGTRTPSATRTATETPEGTRTASATRTLTETPEGTRTPSATRTATETPEGTRTASATRTLTETPEGTRTPSATRTATETPEGTRTASATRTLTETPEGTRTPSATRTATETPEGTRTASATRTLTETPEGTRTPSATRTATETPEGTRTASATRTATETPLGTRTPSATRTGTPAS